MNNGEIMHGNDSEKQLFNKIGNELKEIGYDLSQLKIKHIMDNVFAVGYENKIGFYCDKDGNTYFNLKTIREDSNFELAQVEAGYREIKNKDGEYELYRINDIKEENGKIIPNLKGKIDKYSLEYYNAWNHMCFSTDRINIVQFRDTNDTPKLIKDGKQYTNEQGYYSIEPTLIGVFIDSQSIRIRDLVSFKDHGQISKDVFDKYLPQVRDLLLKQIGDKRFDRINDGVTKAELDGYLKGGYISQELYLEAIQLMVDLGKVDKKILEELKKLVKPKLSELEDEICEEN